MAKIVVIAIVGSGSAVLGAGGRAGR